MLFTRMPRYHQIADALRERIVGGELPPGTRLANQRSLAQEFSVTLMTLRQALEVLDRERLIARRHGLGTFVASPSIDYDILQFRRLAGDLTVHGEPLATRFVGARVLRAERRIAEALRLAPTERAFLLERVRLVDGHPMSLQRSYLPAALGEDVAKADLRVTPLRQILEARLGITVVHARETISTIRLGRREARELGYRAGQPAFFSERVSSAADRRPVVFDRVYIPGDRFRITRELQYEAPGTANGLAGADEPRLEPDAVETTTGPGR